MPIDPAILWAAQNAGFAGGMGRFGGQGTPQGGAFNQGGYDPFGGGLSGSGRTPNSSWANTDNGRLLNSSVNWGAFAGLDNFLQQNPGQAGALRSQGLMPSYNGVPLDQRTGPDRYTSSGLGGGNPSRVKGFGSMDGMQGSPMRSMMPQQQPQGGFNPFGGGGFGAPPMQQPQGQLRPGGFFGGQPGGGGGTMGLPLEGQMQGAIGGILQNPSPFTATQTQQARNRATSGNEQAMRAAQSQARDDAIRRGLNPAEAAANASAIGSRFDRQGQQAGLDFDLANAQATRQGLMGGLQSGLGLTQTQLSNEDSLRRYYAMLQSAQMGQTPAFLHL